MLTNFKKLSKPKNLFCNEKIKNQLYQVLDASVKKLVLNHQKIPVAFSGGIDSSILAYLISKYSKPILFCVGFENSYDARNAKRVAKLFDLKVNFIYLDSLNLEKYFYKTIEIINSDNQMSVELNLPILVLTEELKKRGFNSFVSGQGADTLFSGFARYLKSSDLENDLFCDIKNIYETNLKYNFKACGYFGVKPSYPFLEKEVVELAIKISPKLKIKNDISKYILRKAFEDYLPKGIISQDKKALQYGSGTHKELKKYFN